MDFRLDEIHLNINIKGGKVPVSYFTDRSIKDMHRLRFNYLFGYGYTMH